MAPAREPAAGATEGPAWSVQMGIIKEFRDFAVKGNAVDMAVGIILGGAFGAVVSSLVKDVMMPPLGYVTGGVDFADKKLTLGGLVDGQKPVDITYGLFINAMISFVIVAFALFLLVKGMNRLRKKEEAKPAPPPGPSKEEILLTEIRDLLARGR